MIVTRERRSASSVICASAGGLPCDHGVADQHVEDKIVLIDGTPNHGLARDGEGRFANSRAEFLCPAWHGFVADLDPAHRQHVLDQAQAQRKPGIQKHGHADDVRWETMAAVKGLKRSDHRRDLQNPSRSTVMLTMPKPERLPQSN